MTNVLKSLNNALHQMMRDDGRVIIMGEDILDPYGGAFKVSRGLSDAWPERVYTTPISENGFVGVAAGMSMGGLRPVVEIMFGDFLMLAADQVLNHIAKYRWMYNDQVQVPITIRAPMGGGRGYGPTHSQTVEKHFIGVPGLRVVAPSPFHDPGALLRHCVLGTDDPVLFIENKLMYSRPLRVSDDMGRIGHMYVRTSAGPTPTVSLSYDPFEEADLTIVAYGGMAEAAQSAAETVMMDEEVCAEVIIPSSLNPLDLSPIVESLSRTGRLMVCEEAGRTAGWGGEVIRRVTTESFETLRAAPVHVGARDLPIANTRSLEDVILPQREDLVRAALSLANATTVRAAAPLL
jgi:pyruvate/2-oxoglutarate/acetoin dehydrogenase E1 component